MIAGKEKSMINRKIRRNKISRIDGKLEKTHTVA